MTATRVMGIDPGFTSQGVVVLSQETTGATIQLMYAEVTRTAKTPKKIRRDLRVSADDQRRFQELAAGLERAFKHKPTAMCIETYAPFKAQGGGAWKASAAYGGASFWGIAKGLLVMPFLPQDVKKAMTGKRSSSKQEVENVLRDRIKGLPEFLETIPKGQREHAVDAAGHAMLGIGEMAVMRRMMGMTG